MHVGSAATLAKCPRALAATSSSHQPTPSPLLGLGAILPLVVSPAPEAMIRLIARRLGPSPPHRTIPRSPHNSTPPSNRYVSDSSRPPREPSPAERPPPPPESSSPPPPAFETIINRSADPHAPADPGTSSDIAVPPTPPVRPDLSKLPSLDIDPRVALPEPEGGERQRTGAGRKDYVSSIERQRRAYLRYGLGALVIGGLYAVYVGGKTDGAVRSNSFA